MHVCYFCLKIVGSSGLEFLHTCRSFLVALTSASDWKVMNTSTLNSFTKQLLWLCLLYLQISNHLINRIYSA
jgi:hypothetical protein